MRVEAIFVVALFPTNIAHKRISVTVTTNVNGIQDLIIKGDPTEVASSVYMC